MTVRIGAWPPYKLLVLRHGTVKPCHAAKVFGRVYLLLNLAPYFPTYTATSLPSSALSIRIQIM